MVSFYRPTKRDTKSFEEESILLINTCFQVNFHGYKADDALVEIKRRDEISVQRMSWQRLMK
jgi:kynureninase